MTSDQPGFVMKNNELSGDQAVTLAIPEAYSPSPILQYFTYKHLPEKLASVSRDFRNLADIIDRTLPNGPEKSVALRKLLESKDAAVRAAL